MEISFSTGHEISGDILLNRSNSARARDACFCHFTSDLVWKFLQKIRGISMIWGQMTGVFKGNFFIQNTKKTLKNEGQPSSELTF